MSEAFLLYAVQNSDKIIFFAIFVSNLIAPIPSTLHRLIYYSHPRSPPGNYQQIDRWARQEGQEGTTGVHYPHVQALVNLLVASSKVALGSGHREDRDHPDRVGSFSLGCSHSGDKHKEAENETERENFVKTLQSYMALFFCVTMQPKGGQGEKRTVLGPFVKLPLELQRRAIEIVFYCGAVDATEKEQKDIKLVPLLAAVKSCCAGELQSRC